MGKFSRVALATALMVPLATAPVWAQQYKADFGINGGASWYSAMLGGDETGLADATDGEDVRFKAGWLSGAQITYWFTPKIALRANMAYTDRPIDGEAFEIDHINLWNGTGDLLFRFSEPNETWSGSEFLPYIALGLGGFWHNPAGDGTDCFDAEEDKTWSCVYWTHQNDRSFALGEQKVISGLVGLGADWRLSPRFALRLEANDRIYKPQVYVGEPAVGDPNRFNLTNGDEIVSKVVHQVSGQVGLHMLFGLAERQMVAVQPLPPPPPAAPEPEPEPPPPPAEEEIMVCVVDPTSGTGVRMQPAIRMIQSGDTLVMQGGQRVALRNVVGNVRVARNANWYVAGEPLVMEVGPDRVEFIPYGSARQVEVDELTFVGNVNGFPVYIESGEAADVRDALASLRDARMSGDLGEILAEERDVHDELADVQFWYVPLNATDCVFQPLQRSLPVIKK
jgi:hypothetical protein